MENSTTMGDKPETSETVTFDPQQVAFQLEAERTAISKLDMLIKGYSAASTASDLELQDFFKTHIYTFIKG